MHKHIVFTPNAPQPKGPYSQAVVVGNTVYVAGQGVVWIMTRGGPVNSSEVMATYMYRYAFIRFQLGYGSAVALVMLAICLIFSVAYLRLNRQPDPLSGI